MDRADGAKIFASGPVEIKDSEDHCPFTYECRVTPKADFESKPEYNCKCNLSAKARYYDAAGNALTCWVGGTDDYIHRVTIDKPIKEDNVDAAKTAFQNIVSRNVTRSPAETYVFFRNDKDYSFGHGVKEE